jgi:hypothetical protein
MEKDLSADTAAHAAQQHQVEAMDLQTIPDLRYERRQAHPRARRAHAAHSTCTLGFMQPGRRKVFAPDGVCFC